MAKWIKVWVIIAVCFLIAGGIAFVIGMSSLGWDFMKLDTLEYTEVNVSASDIEIEDSADIESFVYNGYNWNVKVTEGETFSIKYYTTELTTNASVTYSEGKIEFNYEEDWFKGITGFKGLKKSKLKVEVTVPENIELVFNSVNLDIDINGMDTKNISLNGTNSELTLNNMTAGNIIIKGTNADLEINDCTVGDINVASTNCDVDIKNTNGGAITLSGTNLDLKLSGGGFTQISTGFTNNDVTINKCEINGNYEFKGTNIDVKLWTELSANEFKALFSTINFSGTNINAKINEEKIKSYSGEGASSFIAQGTNIGIRIYTV